MKTENLPQITGFADLLLDAVCAVDQSGRFVYASAACERIFGYTPDEMIGRLMIDMVAPEDRARTLEEAREVMSGKERVGFENRYVRKDGRLVHIMWSARWSDTDQLRIAVARDVTRRKRTEAIQAAVYAISEAAQVAEDAQALYRTIYHIVRPLVPADNFALALRDEQTGALIYPWYMEGARRIMAPRPRSLGQLFNQVYDNRAALRLDNLSPTAPLAADMAGLPLAWLGVPLLSNKGALGVLAVMRTDGTAFDDDEEEVLQFISTQISMAIEHKEMQMRLQRQAQYDDLTGLPNRALLGDRLEMAIARAQRDGRVLALLYLDLDKFKMVNDLWGHAAGDGLLQEVARRLQKCVRRADTVARLSGDEFVVLLENFEPRSLEETVQKIAFAVSQPVLIEGHVHPLRVSIGVALYPEHGLDARQLLKHADGAMYQCKRGGGCAVTR
ncbi:diguanylate cyclase (GGDEF)-like protein/PAS domain S-box-containing protein [Silvimonas terrae]|uniref:Diguanylate cyclase (GGDEF)-like protein/PAS domain S-box-containing protein n=1 Tax=Silvimonas terrae TaxID=300266 RepID=A0A840RKW2_9NEIS|nr:GGDEF domain-containing protein [Silvimonas terrae]MBB5193224.1 diguanylate cyclase (GGDEF)-like protein/PAS domain S-box-containing protein [Silvimonas terrae]